jgi:putative ABC transport system permease protein
MFKNYLKIALRNLIRQKAYSFINISGLAIGLACFVIIMFYIRYEFSYESHHKNGDRIYRVNIIQQHSGGEFKISYSMVPLGKALAEEVPEVNDFARLFKTRGILVKYKDKIFYENNTVFTDPGIFDLFTIPVMSGQMESALSGKFSVVITESIAEKYFGEQNPIGQTLLINNLIDNEISFTVTAVVKDFPENTHIKADFLISFNTLAELVGQEFMNNWISVNLQTYILLPENQNLADIEDKISSVYIAHSSSEVKKRFELEQFSRIHLYSDVSTFGDIQYIYIFLAIGVLILLIASINFMNLSTARSARRASEVGLRKVVGAGHWQLIRQFLGESTLMSFLAFMIALLIVDNILPVFKNLTGQELFFPPLDDWSFYGLLIVITLAVGFFSGSYPALYLSAFPPVSILKGKSGSGRKGSNFRKLLVVIQFTIAITLIICTLSISSQLNYMRNKKLGLRKDQIVVVPVNGGDLRKDIAPFKQALLKNSNITNVSGSLMLPSRIGLYNNVTWEGAADNESIPLIFNRVDYDFLETYGIELVKGRNFSREYSSDISNNNKKKDRGAVILNEEAVRRFGWDHPIGKKVIQVFGDNRYYFNVVGVIKDFHFSSLHNKIEPLSLFLRLNNPGKISIKIEPRNIQGTIAYVKDTWNTFNPGYPFEYYFLDETFKQIYQSEERLQSLFNYFSLLSIFISCLGLFGLASFAAERRTKEIGVRKVLGASISNIIFLLSNEFTRWILPANLVAWPIAYITMSLWLQNFAYRTGIGIRAFILSSMAAMIIALLTVSYQSIKASTANPVEALRYE